MGTCALTFDDLAQTACLMESGVSDAVGKEADNIFKLYRLWNMRVRAVGQPISFLFDISYHAAYINHEAPQAITVCGFLPFSFGLKTLVFSRENHIFLVSNSVGKYGPYSEAYTQLDISLACIRLALKI